MTAQALDDLVIEGERRSLCTFPLNSFLTNLPGQPYFPSGVTSIRRGYAATWTIEESAFYLSDFRPLGDLFTSESWMSFPYAHVIRWNEYRGVLADKYAYAIALAAIEKLPEIAPGVRASDSKWSGSRISESNGAIHCDDQNFQPFELLLRSYDYEESTGTRPSLPLHASWYSGLLRSPEGRQLNPYDGCLPEYETDLVIQIERGMMKRQWRIDNRPGYRMRQKAAKVRRK